SARRTRADSSSHLQRRACHNSPWPGGSKLSAREWLSKGPPVSIMRLSARARRAGDSRAVFGCRGSIACSSGVGLVGTISGSASRRRPPASLPLAPAGGRPVPRFPPFDLPPFLGHGSFLLATRARGGRQPEPAAPALTSALTGPVHSWFQRACSYAIPPPI